MSNEILIKKYPNIMPYTQGQREKKSIFSFLPAFAAKYRQMLCNSVKFLLSNRQFLGRVVHKVRKLRNTQSQSDKRKNLDSKKIRKKEIGKQEITKEKKINQNEIFWRGITRPSSLIEKSVLKLAND